MAATTSSTGASQPSVSPDPLIKEFGESLMVQAKKLQLAHLPADKNGRAALTSFLTSTQHATSSEATDALSLSMKSDDKAGLPLLLAYLSSSAADAEAPLGQVDLSRPMAEYYISSSHNTYLTGNQLYSDSSVDGYKNVLLQKCRCVEIDIWNGKAHDEAKQSGSHSLRGKLGLHKKTPSVAEDASASTATGSAAGKAAEPRVLHGHTLTKEVSFRHVCEAIRDSAFQTSDLPIIISLEVHADAEQQAIMVDIMRSAWKGMLLEDSLVSKDVSQLPPPEALRRKILIKVKYTPPQRKQKQQESGTYDSDSEAGEASDTEDQENHPGAPEPSTSDAASTKAKKPKKKKIIDSLSEMGIYTRSCHFSNFDQPEAKLPTHVFAVSENKIVHAMQTQRLKLWAHNRRFFMRAYPKGLRVASTNLDPLPMWRQGVQLVALNWQKRDASCMLNTALFSGSDGWVLKPAAYRDSPSPQPTLPDATPEQSISAAIVNATRSSPNGIALLDLSITFYAAQGLPRLGSHSKPYVKVILHAPAPRRPGEASGSASRENSPAPAASNDAEGASNEHTQGAAAKVRARAASIIHGGSKHTRSSSAGSNASTGGGSDSENSDGDDAGAARRAHARFRSSMTTRNGRGAAPDLGGEIVRIKGAPIEDASLAFARFKVLNDLDLRRDSCVAWACISLPRLRRGVRVLRLTGRDFTSDAGRVLVHVDWQVRPATGATLPMRGRADA